MKFDLIKVVSWDVDGTLYSVRRVKQLLVWLLLREVVRGRALEVGKELMALRRFQARIRAARLASGILDDVLQEISREALLGVERRWYGPAIQRAGPRPGVTDLLAFFAARDLPQVVLSDYQAAYKLESLGLGDRFASIYAGECMGFVKPSPKGLEQIAADFEIAPASLLHIGNRTATDGAAAQKAGCHCLILGRDFRSFHWLLKQLRSTT